MTKKSELAVIDLDKIDVNKLPELANFKERGEKLVKECSFVEIKDNASYELAKKNRTALRTFRTDVEKSDKAIKSKLNNFKNRVGEVSASLIAITEPSEKTQQEEVERYEQIKENERLEKLRLEQERVDNIKKSISVFADFWNTRISVLVFSEIDDFETEMGEAFVNFDKSSLAEFEVLFDDQKKSIYAFFEAKVAQLEDQEEIRLEQIRLAEEREKQRIEAERIAEEQRKEREAIEAKQKAEEEKIRLAKEAFEKEKIEFEEKQAEAKFQERKKFLVDEDYWRIYLLAECAEEEHVAKGKLLNYTDSEFEDFKLAVLKAKEPEMVTQEVEFEETESDESANEIEEKLGELDALIGEESANEQIKKGLSTRLKANTPMPEKELTWDDIESEFIEYLKKRNILIPPGVFKWLSTHYNCPTRKI